MSISSLYRTWSCCCLLIVGLCTGTATAAPTQHCDDSGLNGPPDTTPSCCVADRFGQNPNCTANDGTFAITVIEAPGECILGEPVTVTIQASLSNPNAQTRYDVGIDVALDGGNALNGRCLVGSLPMTTPDGDACGEIHSGEMPLQPLGEVTVLCKDDDGNGKLDFNACTSYGQNDMPVCEESLDTVPGTKAKCGCRLVSTSVIVEPPEPEPDPICRVEVDRQVSCDGGTTWVDMGLASNNEDGTQGCTAIDGQSVQVRYQASNIGNVDLTNCTISESNAGVGSGPGNIGDILVGGTTEFFLDDDQLCSTALEDGEEGTASVSCSCPPNGPEPTTGAMDTADFECATPALSVSKVCAPQDGQGNNAIQITVTNTGDTDLNCLVTDSIFLQDDNCPADVGQGTQLDQTQVSLSPLGQQIINTSVFGLQADACNTATADCDVLIDDAVQDQISDSSDDLCIVPGEGCLTRTPGFWKTHRGVAKVYLPITACGFLIEDFRTLTQALCVNAKEARASGTSMQQLQLARQCAAAELNIKATLEGGGNCLSDVGGLNEIMDSCCRSQASVCQAGLSGPEIGASQCIEQLDAFNNLEDSLDAFGPFIDPGRARPRRCRKSSRDGKTLFGGGGN